MSRKTDSKILLFGHSEINHGTPGSYFRCVALLLETRDSNLLLGCPLYEVTNLDDTYIEHGINLSIIPKVTNPIEVCSRILRSGGIDLHIEYAAIEDLLDGEYLIPPFDHEKIFNALNGLNDFQIKIPTNHRDIKIIYGGRGFFDLVVD